MYKNVVFDVDGTIVDTEQVCIKALQMLVKEYQGRDISAADCLFSIGIPGQTVLPALGLEYNKEVMQAWDRYYASLIGQTKIFDGLVPLLDELKQMGMKLGMVTSRSREEMKTDHNMELLRGRFEVEVLADDTDEHKPTPAPMLHYLKTAGAKAKETLYIGDTIYDWQCAKGAGVDFALAVWGAPVTQGIAAEYLLEHPSDLLALLR